MGWKDYLQAQGYAVSGSMDAKIAEWWAWYTATHKWYSSTVRSNGRTHKVQRISVKPARMVCQEWASLLLNERTQVSTEDEASNEWLETYLNQTRFLISGQRLVERSMALGTAAWALRVDGLVENAAFSPGARIIAQRFDARQIVPLTYDEDTCTECAFISGVTVRGKSFQQLQLHLLAEDSTYVVRTIVLDEDSKPVELPGIAAEFTVRSATPLFALIKPGLENTHVDWSPFGVSVFDDALGAVRLVDEAIDNTHKDLHLGQKILFLDERMLDKDSNGNIVVPREADQQLFRRAEMDSGQSMMEEYNPDLRVNDNRLAIRTALELLGSRTGLGSDYFNIEGASGLRTATEVSADQSDLFRNVRKHENSLAPAIQQITAGILTLAKVVRGEPIPDDYGEITVNFDDSIIEDSEAQRTRDLREVAGGIMQPWEFRAKWYGEDEQTAKAMVEGASLVGPLE